MKENSIPAAAERISRDIGDYVNMKVASAKLSVVEGLSKTVGGALKLLVLIIFCYLGLMAFLAAAIISLGIWMGSFVWASLIVGGICIMLGLLFYALRGLFVNPMVKMFSGMFFPIKKNHQDEED